MELIELCTISDRYVNFLRNYDQKVLFNKYSEERGSRKYVGILFEVNEHKYFAPLSSPKTKHLSMKDGIDIVKIKDGELGVINLNNMLPVVESEYAVINIKSLLDSSYKTLLQDQRNFCNNNKAKIIAKARKLHGLYVSNKCWAQLKARCCNFPLLEKASLNFK